MTQGKDCTCDTNSSIMEPIDDDKTKADILDAMNNLDSQDNHYNNFSNVTSNISINCSTDSRNEVKRFHLHKDVHNISNQESIVKPIKNNVIQDGPAHMKFNSTEQKSSESVARLIPSFDKNNYQKVPVNINNHHLVNNFPQAPVQHYHYQHQNNHQYVPQSFEDLKSININCESFILIDAEEELRITSCDILCKKLGCLPETKIKVVSIFGNTGDGKSHTMNHTFFNGEEVFRTSPAQDSCTFGVWASLDKVNNILCLDTEGLLGITLHENQRMRMLLKVLAISDIVIYRTRSERLHNDMFTFLGTASIAFQKHFLTALQSLGIPGPSQSLGPAIIIFHETRDTAPIESTVADSAEHILRQKFSTMNINFDAFSSLRYIGKQNKNLPTDYAELKAAVIKEVENTSVRSARQPEIIFKAIEALNLKFSDKIVERQMNPFPEQYFACCVQCICCNVRCERSMGHIVDGEKHFNQKRCRYVEQYKNKVYLCITCHKLGQEVIVENNTNSLLESFPWLRAGIECPNCGNIYNPRKYWYGNPSFEDAVRLEIVHIWSDGKNKDEIPRHSAQIVLDNVNYYNERLYQISSPSSKAAFDWLTDKIAPSYWKSNSEIMFCYSCKISFSSSDGINELKKHHCRGCGEGFCHSCSAFQISVPARGWENPVRVCQFCHEKLKENPNACPSADNCPPEKCIETSTDSSSRDSTDIMVRQYGEVVFNTLSTVASVLDYSKEIIKDSARPSYWVPDVEAPNCSICKFMFGTAEEIAIANQKERNRLLNNVPESSKQVSRLTNQHLQNVDSTNNAIPSPSSTLPITTETIIINRNRHHCRACGKAVCNMCSLGRHAVPELGWMTKVRVCNTCAKTKFKKTK